MQTRPVIFLATLAAAAISFTANVGRAGDCSTGDCQGSVSVLDGGTVTTGSTIADPMTEGSVGSGDHYVGDLPATAVYGQRRGFGQPDLFYNYYTQGNANAANAQMYLSPVPVPPNVGHTFYTYQPFYPHHMLYAHQDRYHNYYDGGRGLNRTKATYYYPPVKTAVQNLYWNVLRIPR